MPLPNLVQGRPALGSAYRVCEYMVHFGGYPLCGMAINQNIFDFDWLVVLACKCDLPFSVEVNQRKAIGFNLERATWQHFDVARDFRWLAFYALVLRSKKMKGNTRNDRNRSRNTRTGQYL